jgi:hypothetical protein
VKSSTAPLGSIRTREVLVGAPILSLKHPARDSEMLSDLSRRIAGGRLHLTGDSALPGGDRAKEAEEVFAVFFWWANHLIGQCSMPRQKCLAFAVSWKIGSPYRPRSVVLNLSWTHCGAFVVINRLGMVADLVSANDLRRRIVPYWANMRSPCRESAICLRTTSVIVPLIRLSDHLGVTRLRCKH